MPGKSKNSTNMETSDSIKEISKAILAAQMEMGTAAKGASNPFFKSKYADLNSIREACMPALHANGITALQPTVHIEGKNYVQTILLHETGEFISSLTEIVYAKEKDAQAQGSGITYARRYGLQSLMNVGAEDDDGNGASNPQVKNGNGSHVSVPTAQTAPGKPELLPSMSAWKKAVQHIAGGGVIDQVKKTYSLTPALEKELLNEAKTFA